MPIVCSVVTYKKMENLAALIPNPTPLIIRTNNFQVETQENKSISSGKFGRFGGKYVLETLMSCLSQLEAEFNFVLNDIEFQMELAIALRDYIGRETPLYHAGRLTKHYKNENGEGPEIYLKREDLNHVGAHKINNAVAQAMLAKRMGRTSIVAATGAGQHGVATAAACAKLALECTIIMGTTDMERQSSNVTLMNLLGTKVKSVDGNFKDATSEAIREWVGNLETSYYLTGTVVGPHPFEAAGFGLDSGKHSTTLTTGEVGVYHGAMNYLLRDEGRIVPPHSIGV
ncbi:Pyridoxal-phosphate dependent enzyme, partial [Dillenia turbinata]